MAKPAACTICEEKFGIFRWRLECTECGKIVCSGCSEKYNFLDRRICKPCAKIIDDGISKVNLVVKSDHVGGHNIIKSYETVTGDFWARNPQDTIDNIKYKAHKVNANALVSLKIEKGTGSESGDGRGTHYYSIFLASARPVKVIKKTQEKNKKDNMAKEIEKLSELKDKGIITED